MARLLPFVRPAIVPVVMLGCFSACSSTQAPPDAAAHPREEAIADSFAHSLATGLPASYSDDPEYLPPRPPSTFYSDPGHPHHHGRRR